MPAIHINASDDVDIDGKLNARQIATYHHDVFQALGLPKRTFGGTPFKGELLEADWTAWALWCPSCEDAP